MKVFLLVLHRFCKNKALEVCPGNLARVQAVGALFASRSGKRCLVQPFGEVQQTGRGCPESRLSPGGLWKCCQRSVGTDPGQPARTRAGDSSMVGPESWEDRDKPFKEKELLISEGGCVQGASGCPAMGTPRVARVGETLARLMPISCSTMELRRGLEQFTPLSTAVSPLRRQTVLLRACAVP